MSFDDLLSERLTFSDSLDEIENALYERGCTDGLPIIPPTPERVREMIEYNSLDPQQVIAAKVPPGAIDDVESDVLLRFSRKVYSGDEVTNPVGLLLRMATFCRADFHANRPATESSLGEWDAASDDAALDDLAVSAAVDDLLAPLGDRQRDVVWLRIIEGRSSAEVAAMLETTAGNIDVIVHRALSRMREAQP